VTLAVRMVWLVLAVCLVSLAPARAHEVNPAYLEVTETDASEYSIVWKQPVKDGRRLKIDPVFPTACEKRNVRVSQAPGVIVERWETSCDLAAATLAVSGLDRTLTDVFVRISRMGADPISAVLKAGRPSVDLSVSQGAPVFVYLGLGIEHILLGYDHLLFVLGLVLLVRGRQIFATVTAFTIAHSITLALSTLAGISLPGPPVEITIALSLALLAREALSRLRGEQPLSGQYPWLIAFGFGLIHGFGFAGALSQIGLPAGAEALALALFNIGVEVGQLAFIAVILMLGWGIHRYSQSRARLLRIGLAYFVGTAGVYWVLERSLGVVLN